MPRRTADQQMLATLGARIAEIRRARGMSQADVAEAAGLDPQSLQRAERGKVSLSLRRLRRVAAALGVEIAELFADPGAEVPASPWGEDEGAASAAWRRVPDERRDLALRVLREMGR